MDTGELKAGGEQGEVKYSQTLHAIETGISSGLMGHLARMKTLSFYSETHRMFSVYVTPEEFG